MILRTERLTLRRARRSDLHALHDIYGDERAMRYWSSPPDRTLEQTRGRLQRQLDDPADPPTYFVLDRDGDAIGNAGMWRDYEVGFILHPAHWRQGLVTEAMTTIIPHLFEVTDAPALTADADPNNLASVNCLKSLGFSETARVANTYCVDGVWSDSVYLELPRPA